MVCATIMCFVRLLAAVNIKLSKFSSIQFNTNGPIYLFSLQYVLLIILYVNEMIMLIVM